MTKAIPPKNVVLYADDDPDDLQLVKDAFSHYSQNVELVTVWDGAEALSFLNNLPDQAPTPCLVILDINMPRKNGKEVLVKLRETERFEDIPVILFTTSSMPQDKDFADKYKAGFVTKPIDYKQIDLIANTFIEHCTEEIKKKIRK